jgi:hypothetical protein
MKRVALLGLAVASLSCSGSGSNSRDAALADRAIPADVEVQAPDAAADAPTEEDVALAPVPDVARSLDAGDTTVVVDAGAAETAPADAPLVGYDTSIERGVDLARSPSDVTPSDSDPCGSSRLVWAYPIATPGYGMDISALDLTVLPDSSIVVVGAINGGGSGAPFVFGTGTANQVSLTVSGAATAFWARYSANGEFLAARTFPAQTSTFTAVRAFTDGSFAVLGDFAGTLFVDLGLASERKVSADSYKDSDLFVARIGADGNPLWIAQGSGKDSAAARTLAVLPDGKVAVVGGGTATFGLGQPDELTTGPGQFLLLLSAEGKPLWKRALTFSSGSLKDLRVLDDGSLALVGWFFASLTLEGSPSVSFTGAQYNESMFLARYLVDGSLVFARKVSNRSLGMHVASGDAGQLIVTGVADAKAVFGDGEASAASLAGAGSFIARFASHGDFLGVVASGTGYEDEFGLVRSKQAGLVSVGTFNYWQTFGTAPGERKLTSLGWQDVYVVCLNPSGQLGWIHQIGGTQNDFGRGVANLPGGDIVVAGHNRITATASVGEDDAVVIPQPNVASGSFLVRYTTQ